MVVVVWLFADSVRGGERVAVMEALGASAESNVAVMGSGRPNVPSRPMIIRLRGREVAARSNQRRQQGATGRARAGRRSDYNSTLFGGGAC